MARQYVVACPADAVMPTFTPDGVMDGATPAGHVVIYDDDRYDMGGVMAGLLPCDGVLLVTSRLENNAV